VEDFLAELKSANAPLISFCAVGEPLVLSAYRSMSKDCSRREGAFNLTNAVIHAEKNACGEWLAEGIEQRFQNGCRQKIRGGKSMCYLRAALIARKMTADGNP